MSPTIYGTVLGNPQAITQYNNIDPTFVGSPASGLQYPSSNFITTFGPVYLPRVYASNLSALEIGSSGTIEYTLYDVSSLEMSRNVASSNVIIQTPNLQDSLWIGANNSNMYLSMDAMNNNNVATLYGSNGLNLYTSNDMLLSASNIKFEGYVTLNGSNIQSTSSSGSSSTTQNIGSTSYTVAADNSNSFFQMNSDVQLFTKGTLAMGASNDLTAIAMKDMKLNASNTFKVATNENNMLFEMAYPSNTMALYTTNTLLAGAYNDISLNGCDSNQYLTFIHDNVTTTLSNQEVNGIMNIGVLGTMNVYSLTSKTEINDGTYFGKTIGAFTESNSSTKDVSVQGTYTESNFASRNVYVAGSHLESNASTKTVNVNSVYTESNFDARNVYVAGPHVERNFATKDVNVNGTYTESNMNGRNLYASFVNEKTQGNKNLTVTGVHTESNLNSKNIHVTYVLNEKSQIKMVETDVLNELTLNTKTTKNISYHIESNCSTKYVAVHDDCTESNYSTRNLFVENDYKEFINGSKNQHSEGTTILESKQNMSLKSTNANVYIETPNTTYITSGVNTITMAPSTSIVHNAVTSHDFNINNNTTLQVVQSNVIITGNLQISGVIDSTNVTQTNLLVENKEIYLAYNSNVLPADSTTWIKDGAANDKSGIVVQGCPSTILQYSPSNNEYVYEKSVKWNNNLGMFTGNSNESSWEIKGGSLKMTDMNPQGWDNLGNVTASNPISFHFRINNQAELEIIKYYTMNNQSISQVVAKFGRTPGFNSSTLASA